MMSVDGTRIMYSSLFDYLLRSLLLARLECLLCLTKINNRQS